MPEINALFVIYYHLKDCKKPIKITKGLIYVFRFMIQLPIIVFKMHLFYIWCAQKISVCNIGCTNQVGYQNPSNILIVFKNIYISKPRYRNTHIVISIYVCIYIFIYFAPWYVAILCSKWFQWWTNHFFMMWDRVWEIGTWFTHIKLKAYWNEQKGSCARSLGQLN